jgi:TatD DNase family protein
VRFVDSHLHLSDYPRASEILRAVAQTKMAVLACSVDKASSERTLALTEDNPGTVSAFVGIHPSETKSQRGIEWLPDLLARASGVGEIGLDPKYSEVGSETQQMTLFREQLAFAEAAGKPVQVHSRNAEASCLDELETHRLTSVLLHWFNGESDMGRAEQSGYFVSFGPALIESRKLQRMAARYSADLILVESDGPVAFAPLGGAEGPTVVPSVVFKLAELKGVSFEEMAETTVRNASAYLPALGKVKPMTDSGLDRKIGQD